MLPLLRLIVADISLAHREITERRSNLHRLLRNSDRQLSSELHESEVEETRKDLRLESQQVEAYIGELESLGVVLRSAHDGIVDFPTQMDDAPAFFCWKMGEVEIRYWHKPNQPVADRVAIPASMLELEKNTFG